VPHRGQGPGCPPPPGQDVTARSAATSSTGAAPRPTISRSTGSGRRASARAPAAAGALLVDEIQYSRRHPRAADRRHVAPKHPPAASRHRHRHRHREGVLPHIDVAQGGELATCNPRPARRRRCRRTSGRCSWGRRERHGDRPAEPRRPPSAIERRAEGRIDAGGHQGVDAPRAGRASPAGCPCRSTGPGPPQSSKAAAIRSSSPPPPPVDHLDARGQPGPPRPIEDGAPAGRR